MKYLFNKVSTKHWIACLSVLILASAVFLAYKWLCNCNQPTDNSSGSRSSTTQTPTPTEPVIISITINESGFEPAVIKIKPGTTLRWENHGSTPRQIASNPYPERTELPELNAPEPIWTGQSYEFTFHTLGIFGYHDYLSPAVNGQVIVSYQ